MENLSAWWSLALFGAGIPVFAVLGVIGYSEAFNSPEIHFEDLYRARFLKEELERRGFVADIYEYPERRTVAVDIYDPTLERRVIELTGRLDAERFIRYITHIGRGSVAFRDGRVEGDVPVIALRPIEATGWIREALFKPRGLDIEEVHVHTYDSVTSVHVHLVGEYLTLDELKDLVRFITLAREATRTFATPVVPAR